MPPPTLLALAAELAEGATDLHWRAAVGRAYCAILQEGSEFMARMGFRPPRADLIHAYLARRLGNAGHAGVVSVAETLSRLRMEQVRADHDPAHPFRQPVARELVEAATEAVALLESGRYDEEELAHIRTTIRDHERDHLREDTWFG